MTPSKDVAASAMTEPISPDLLRARMAHAVSRCVLCLAEIVQGCTVLAEGLVAIAEQLTPETEQPETEQPEAEAADR